jgi:hypothetical protein
LRKPSDSECSGSQQHLQDQEKKTRKIYSKFKAMLIVFFDIQGAVMAEWVISGQTVNQQCHLEVLTKLHKRVREKRAELWRKVGFCIKTMRQPTTPCL